MVHIAHLALWWWRVLGPWHNTLVYHFFSYYPGLDEHDLELTNIAHEIAGDRLLAIISSLPMEDLRAL